MNPESIQVYDDLIQPPLFQEICSLGHKNIWSYGWKSHQTAPYGYWHVYFAGGGHLSNSPCEEELSKNKDFPCIYNLWTTLKNTALKNHTLVRAYANAHTYGVEGYSHIDNLEDGYVSNIFYAHELWNVDWGGETLFYTRDRTDTIKSVYPKPGRLVSFPGYIPHRANALSRICPCLRISIVLKTRLA